MGSPCVRRCLCRGVPAPAQRRARDARLGGRARVTVDRPRVLRARWLGRVAYREAEVLQRAIHARAVHDGVGDDYLLLLEHPHVYTLGSRASQEHIRFADPAAVGAELVIADRGGDVTYHGPGQLVGYPIVTLDEWRGGQRDVVAYVRALEQVLIDALDDIGVSAMRSDGYTGVWVDTPRGP